jgi:citronellol/citronellal dehydrogenase
LPASENKFPAPRTAGKLSTAHWSYGAKGHRSPAESIKKLGNFKNSLLFSLFSGNPEVERAASARTYSSVAAYGSSLNHFEIRRFPVEDRHMTAESPMSLKGKTLFITGASRGIGLAVALRAARDGANIAIAAKTETPHPKLPGTIHTAAAEIEAAGGRALALAVDVRDEGAVKDAIARTATHFGGIDIVVNNASAISLTRVADTDMRRFDLMHQINTRGTFMVSKYAIPHLAKAANPHILMMSPPLDMAEKWFAPHTAYTMAKFGMSMVVLGLAGELRPQGIAVNALWPRTTIATAAIKNLLGGEEIMRRSRRPDILAEAAYRIFAKPAASFSGHFLIDDTFLAAEGVADFEPYRVDPQEPLSPDFFVPDHVKPPPGVIVPPRDKR